MKSLLILTVGLVFGVIAVSAAEIYTTPVAAIDGAKAAAKRNDALATEQALIQATNAAPNSVSWHIEVAQRLIQVAYDVPREGRSDIIPNLIARALQYLTQAETLTTDVRLRSSIKALAGMIHERFRGDHASALASYRAASQLSPDNPSAKYQADRLQRLDDNMKRKGR
jgi:hypothetical protein